MEGVNNNLNKLHPSPLWRSVDSAQHSLSCLSVTELVYKPAMLILRHTEEIGGNRDFADWCCKVEFYLQSTEECKRPEGLVDLGLLLLL